MVIKSASTTLFAVLLVPLLAGCDSSAEAHALLEPELILLATGPDGYEAPEYARESDVPPEYFYAEVRNPRGRVGWDGAEAQTYVAMDFFGNRGTMKVELSVIHGNGGSSSWEFEHKMGRLVPNLYGMGSPGNAMTGSDCGQVANNITHFEARTVVFIDYRFTQLASDAKNRSWSASQPGCENPTDTETGGDGDGSGGEGSGGGGDTGDDGPSWCMVETWYWIYEDGSIEIISQEVLYCN